MDLRMVFLEKAPIWVSNPKCWDIPSSLVGVGGWDQGKDWDRAGKHPPVSMALHILPNSGSTAHIGSLEKFPEPGSAPLNPSSCFPLLINISQHGRDQTPDVRGAGNKEL